MSETWGQWGSIAHHRLYLQPADRKSRRRCFCGCRKRATHLLMANGVAMSMGCELEMRRRAKHYKKQLVTVIP
jgi:hypothetical protein